MYGKFTVFLIAVLTLGLTVGLAHAELVGHWRLDEGAGTTAYDSSGNGNNGTLVGDAQWVGARKGGGVRLDGDGDYVHVPDFGLTSDTVTFVAMIEGWKAADWAGIVTSRDVADAGGMWFGDDDALHYVWNQDAADTWGWADGPVIPQDEWAVVAFCIEPTQATATVVTLSGEVRSGVNAIAHQSLTLEGLAFGWDLNRDPRYFRGVIDEVRVYDEALDEAQILAILEEEPATQAYGPRPENGSLVEAVQATLEWVPGDLATSHAVYFGESFDDVNEGRVEAVATTEPSLAIGSAPPYATGLTPGQTYYWRVDEVSDTDPDSPWKGHVWSFRVRPAIAWSPSPADGIPNVRPDQLLIWEPGMGALFHTVYFGESFDEVNDATTGGFMIADASYDPGPFELGKTYYWRVDEFAGTGTQKGETWSFTTVPEVAVTDPSLLGWWTLDEGVGMTAVDQSGHGNHGVIIGDPQWVDAYYSLALDFDGSDYVDTGNTTDLAAWTIAGWVKSPAAPAATAASGPIHRERNYSIDWNHANEIFRGSVAMAVDGTWHAASFLPLAANTWYHLAATFDGTALVAYKDGVLITSNTAAAGVPETEPESLKLARHAAAANFFEGVIDDVRLYDKALSENEIRQIMRGNPLLAGAPDPQRGAMLDIRDATALRWSAGDTAVSHDVYFGTDRDAVAAADKDAPEFQGNQPGTSLSLAGRVEFGGGDYYWRIDEVEAAGTVQTGYLWRFNVPDFLAVDDFESYSNEVGSRVFEKWVDGVGFTLPEPGDPGNATGALVGHDIWSVDSPYFEGTIVETADVYDGSQAMPVYYDNTFSPYLSEADRTFTPGQNWTVEGVTTLVVHFRGEADNTGDLYVKINGVKVPYDGDPADIASREWIAWEIDLASVGVSLTNVMTMTIGIEGGETGVVYVDDIILTKP